MAARLRELESRYRSILFVCSILDWPWIRDAYQRRLEAPEPESFFSPIATYAVDPRTLIFALGELPYITGLYERGRRELLPDDNLSVDGVKEMVLDARERLEGEASQDRAADHAAALVGLFSVRPQPVASRPTADARPLHAGRGGPADGRRRLRAGAGRDGPNVPLRSAGEDDTATSPEFEEPGLARMGIDQAELPVWGTGPMVSRLPGQALSWRTCELRPRPQKDDQSRWRQRWDPFGMCSWPPEDDRIESFHRHVREQARAILGADLARTEKFTTSVRDGIDIRETLRNWHTGGLYVKVVPPSRGSLEVVVFLFEIPADPQVYVNRTTWYAEHAEESTLAFYATDPMKNLVGPGIAQAQYGGASSSFRRGRSPTSGSTSGSISPKRSKNGCWPRRSCTARTGTSRS